MQEIRKQETSGLPEEQASEAETTGGSPEEEASPASDAGPIVIDPAKEYQFGQGENSVSLLGTEVQNMVGRAAIAQQQQSRADQATARAEQLEQAYTGEKERNAQLEQAIAQVQQREQIAEGIREQLPAASRQSQASEDTWSTAEEGTSHQPPVNPDQIAQQVTDIAQQTVREESQQQFGNVEELVTKVVTRVMEEQTAQRAMQENAQRWATDSLEERKNRYITDYGFESQQAENIAKLFDASSLHEDAGRQAAAGGDSDTAVQHYNEAKRLTTAGTEQLARQIVKHEEQQQLSEFEAQVESGQVDGLPEPAETEVDLSKPNPYWKPENRGAFKAMKEAKKNRAIAKAEKMRIATDAVNAQREKLNAR